MSISTIVILALYVIFLGGGGITLLIRTSLIGRMVQRHKNAKISGDRFGSRYGFIISVIGMCIGVGSLWRFPMMCAKWGGGAFVLAFAIICLTIVIPAGWAELAYGRHYRGGTIGCGKAVAGNLGIAYGWMQSIVSLGVWCYYPMMMSLILIYIFKSFKGLSTITNNSAKVYESTNDNKTLIYVFVVLILLIVALVVVRGIERGIERFCKILLPILLIAIVIVAIRVCMIPGIGEGIDYYIKPDWAQLANPKMWTAAAGTALFAVGLGPGCLLIYGRYVDDDQDIATDFITINIVQLFICILSGLIVIPTVQLMGMDPISMGRGVMFVALPRVFATIPAGEIFFALFLMALLVGGITSSFNQLEIATSALMDKDGFGFSRKKAIAVCFAIAILVAISCIFNDDFYTKYDLFFANFGYNLCAFILVLLIGWKYGATKARQEWYLPTSAIKWGGFIDYLYKYLALFAFGYFTVTSFIALFQ